jgi:hypothetical protein
MKKIILGLILASLLGAVLIFLVKPEWAFDATPFLWSGYHKKVITDRTATLVDHLRHDNMAGCLALTDPGYIRQRGGEDRAKGHFAILGLMRTLNLQQDDVRVDEIALASDSKSAQVKVSIRKRGKWEPNDTYRWVRVDGNWYITFNF